MKAETLRKSILQWAMEGKLVPQLNCEPAVEQIGEAPEEVPFAIPEKWKWLRFGDLGTFSSPRRVHKSEWKSKGIPFLRARELANLADTGTLVNELFIDEELFRIRTSKGETPNPGDLVFTAVGTLGKCYVVKSDDIFFCKDTNTLRFSSHKQYSEYLRTLFQTPYLQGVIQKTAVGSTVKNLTIGVMRDWWIPVPPIEEQRRIVQKLNELLPLVESYGREQLALEQLEKELPGKLRASLLSEAIQGKLAPQLDTEPAVDQIGEVPEDVPFAIPEKWKWTRIQDVATLNPKITTHDESLKVSFAPMASVDAGYINHINTSDERSWSSVKTGYAKFAEDDILLAKITPCFQNRKSAIATNLKNGIGCGSTEFHVLRASKEVDKEYLLMFLKSQWFIEYGVENFKGTAGQQRLGTADLKSCPFPLPPLKEQRRIVEKLNVLFKDLDRLTG